ncbi:MAG: hypothetical protein PUG15_06490 [Bacteroidales bacterium]|nr:hypothetical protein [Bacteroidales bacterium]
MKKFWNIAFIIFFILLIPLAPILWILKDDGKGVSDEKYKKMEEDKQRMLMSSGLITFF